MDRVMGRWEGIEADQEGSGDERWKGMMYARIVMTGVKI